MDNSTEDLERMTEVGSAHLAVRAPDSHRIRLSTNFPWMPLHRQTPGSAGVWQGYRFVTDDAPDANLGEFAACVIYNNLPHDAPLEIRCPAERTFLLVGEPPSRGALHPDFAAQFATVITCRSESDGDRTRRTQQCLPWWVGLRRRSSTTFETRLDYDRLSAMSPISKTGVLSIVCSNLIITPEHRQRLDFVRRLQSHFGSRLAVFGSGFRPVEDKWDAIAPFKYHIALENSSVADYWTEKLADTFLGGALPIYAGCPNINDYFSPASLLRIHIDRPEDAIERIEHAIASGRYEASLAAILESRRRVLEEYNLYPFVTRLVETIPSFAGVVTTRIRPSGSFAPSAGMRVRRLRYLAREAVARRWYRLVG